MLSVFLPRNFQNFAMINSRLVEVGEFFFKKDQKQLE